MAEQSAIFLDLPAFPIEALKDQHELVRGIVLSERIKHWYRSGKENAEPTRVLKEVKGYRTTARRKQFAGVLRGFLELPVGSIVIVPPSDHQRDVLFGEIIDDELDWVETPVYGDSKIPARKVKWLSRKPRNSIPTWLERKIPSPNPLRQIEKSFFPAIFDMMYERYFYNDEFVCKFSTTSKEFSALDNYLFQQVVLYITALHEAKNDENIKDISSKPISEVVSEIDFSDDIPDQRIAINSPGHIVIYAKNIIPLLTAVMIAMASVNAQAGSKLPPDEIVITNSVDQSSLSKQCIAEVAEEATYEIDAMGYQRWQELCKIEQAQRKRTGLSSGVVVTEKTSPKQDRLKRD
ncbi:hypothetical protein CQZ93_19610 [Ochrobactrum vermis]|nr:hypothetical protein CQZ93_19610 [Ochrobactrum vermis]